MYANDQPRQWVYTQSHVHTVLCTHSLHKRLVVPPHPPLRQVRREGAVQDPRRKIVEEPGRKDGSEMGRRSVSWLLAGFKRVHCLGH